jgi:hypothetical protein
MSSPPPHPTCPYNMKCHRLQSSRLQFQLRPRHRATPLGAPVHHRGLRSRLIRPTEGQRHNACTNSRPQRPQLTCKFQNAAGHSGSSQLYPPQPEASHTTSTTQVTCLRYLHPAGIKPTHPPTPRQHTTAVSTPARSLTHNIHHHPGDSPALSPPSWNQAHTPSYTPSRRPSGSKSAGGWDSPLHCRLNTACISTLRLGYGTGHLGSPTPSGCPGGCSRPTYSSPSSTHRQFTGGREFCFPTPRQ